MTPTLAPEALRIARRYRLNGVVQGVGLRPAVFRLATSLGLGGRTRNVTGGLQIDVEGSSDAVEKFGELLPDCLPAGARPSAVDDEVIPATGRATFRIQDSNSEGLPSVAAPPDRATCQQCFAEVVEPGNARRFEHAFTGCSECGPRYSILHALPFDRAVTEMSAFPLCPACRHEYGSPYDRRFHAQIICCASCGPRIWLGGATGEWLPAVVAALREGKIVALKGVGGYQLLCDATNPDAVRRLRERKQRPLKPLAVLVASLEQADKVARIDSDSGRALADSANPIVLVPNRADSGLAVEVNPGLNTVGLLLPTTPLHWFVATRFGQPLICTSGNREGEPLEINPADAERRLAGVADLWLHHDRPITRPLDDSVVRVIAGRTVTLRLGRGLTPLPLALPEFTLAVAVGGQQKNALAWCNGAQAALGAHIGDLESSAVRRRFVDAIADARQLYQFTPELLIHDAHPDYTSTRWAGEQETRLFAVQHHHAHMAAAIVEHGWLDRDVLAVAWDGTGLGADGTIWGGEFLMGSARESKRVAHFRPFRLPGGEATVRQPWRVAAVILRDAVGPERTMRLLRRIDPQRVVALFDVARLERFSPVTTSAGRLFDAVACLLLGIDDAGFDGRPAMLLEAACDLEKPECYPVPISGSPAELDWRLLVAGLANDLERGVAPGKLATRFHRSLARAIVAVSQRWPDLPVVLTGGVFQNRILTEMIAAEWPATRPLGLPGRIPPNDGGLAAGQLAVALAQNTRGR